MKTVEQIVDELVAREGGYVNNPADRGGPTNWGITEPVARAFGYRGDMQAMPIEVARSIYRERFWQQPGFSRIGQIDLPLAIELMDTGVNMGTATAAKFLQRSLNVLNLGGTLYPDLTVDGAIGRLTLYALERLIAHRGPDGRAVILAMVNALQSARYIEIAEANPTQETFEFGWQVSRVASPL